MRASQNACHPCGSPVWTLRMIQRFNSESPELPATDECRRVHVGEREPDREHGEGEQQDPRGRIGATRTGPAPAAAYSHGRAEERDVVRVRGCRPPRPAAPAEHDHEERGEQRPRADLHHGRPHHGEHALQRRVRGQLELVDRDEEHRLRGDEPREPGAPFDRARREAPTPSTTAARTRRRRDTRPSTRARAPTGGAGRAGGTRRPRRARARATSTIVRSMCVTVVIGSQGDACVLPLPAWIALRSRDGAGGDEVATMVVRPRPRASRTAPLRSRREGPRRDADEAEHRRTPSRASRARARIPRPRKRRRAREQRAREHREPDERIVVPAVHHRR